jgi:hypothetical protein
MLDNKALKAYLEAIESCGLEWELVPSPTTTQSPKDVAVAEKGIQTAKERTSLQTYLENGTGCCHRLN